MLHPNSVLLGAHAGAVFLPAVDHYCGLPKRIEKALALQAEWIRAHGFCGFDVTLDCEDGAPVGAEEFHANQLSVLVKSVFDATKNVAFERQPRCAVRIHPVDHRAFESDVRLLVVPHAERLTHVMLPKAESVADVIRLVALLDQLGAAQLPVHCLIESPLAVHNAFEIAAHHRVQSLSFGLMDFVSAHGGALDEAAMSASGQFSNPQVLRAKLEIAAACHAYGKVPSHCVVTEFNDAAALQRAAAQAREMGYTRMWSIHPNQIAPILQAFAPNSAQIAKATELLLAAQAADWAPIRYSDVLHDRASYRLYWSQLQRAHAAGLTLPRAARAWF